MCAIPVFFTGQYPWNPNASTIVLFCFCQIIANYQKHESNDQISEQSNIHIYSKSNSIARAHNNRGKCSHEPHKCPDQLRTDVLAFWINMGEKKAKPHHCKHKKRKSENGNCLAAPAIWSISSGKMGRELCRKLIPQKQSDQDWA